MSSNRLAVILSGALFAFGFAYLTQAQVPMTGAGLGKPTAAASFQGIGDVVASARFYGSCGRAYTAAFAATAAAICDVVDTATGASSCTLKTGTNGFADLTSNVCVSNTVSVTTFCTVTNAACSVTKVYDQTSNGFHMVQATLANMPGFTLNAQNSLPGLTFGGTKNLASATRPGDSMPFTFSWIAKRTSGTAIGSVLDSAAALIQSGFANSANTLYMYDGTVIPNAGTATDGSFYAVQQLFANPSAISYINGTSNNVTLATSRSLATSFGMSSANQVVGIVLEATVWAGDQSLSFSILNSNQRGSTSGWNF